ncbi:MAG: response regulator [Candidatus Rokubacteria bacterium]|nr:response regulator [Candidatus Rokubacteria bacterium]
MTSSNAVLVVDAEPDFAVSYDRLLRRRGFFIVSVASRAEALSQIASVPLALVIVDVRLPDGDGLEVVRAARSTRPPTPAVVVTTSASEASRRETLSAGAVDYLVKPFAITAFSQILDRTLGPPAGRDAPSGATRPRPIGPPTPPVAGCR